MYVHHSSQWSASLSSPIIVIITTTIIIIIIIIITTIIIIHWCQFQSPPPVSKTISRSSVFYCWLHLLKLSVLICSAVLPLNAVARLICKFQTDFIPDLFCTPHTMCRCRSRVSSADLRLTTYDVFRKKNGSFYRCLGMVVVDSLAESAIVRGTRKQYKFLQPCIPKTGLRAHVFIIIRWIISRFWIILKIFSGHYFNIPPWWSFDGLTVGVGDT